MDSSFPEALLIACLTSTDWLTASCQSPGESDTHVHSASCYGRLPVLDDANYSTMGSPACGSTLLQSNQERGSSRKDERRPLRVINGVKGESSITGSIRRNGILKINNNHNNNNKEGEALEKTSDGHFVSSTVLKGKATSQALSVGIEF